MEKRLKKNRHEMKRLVNQHQPPHMTIGNEFVKYDVVSQMDFIHLDATMRKYTINEKGS